MSDENNYPNGDDQLENHPPVEHNDLSGNNAQADRYAQSDEHYQQPQDNRQPYDNQQQSQVNRQPYDNQQQSQGYQQSYENYPYSGNYQQTQNNYQSEEPNGMATASLVLGIISIVSSCCFCAAIPLAGLSIILAILSKGGAMRMSDRAKTGLGISIASFCITVLLTAGVFFVNRSVFSSDEFRTYFKDSMDYYGNDYNSEEIDKMFDDFF